MMITRNVQMEKERKGEKGGGKVSKGHRERERERRRAAGQLAWGRWGVPSGKPERQPEKRQADGKTNRRRHPMDNPLATLPQPQCHTATATASGVLRCHCLLVLQLNFACVVEQQQQHSSSCQKAARLATAATAAVAATPAVARL